MPSPRTSWLGLTLLAAALVLPASAGVAEPDALAWPPATAECRPWTRWWWLGSAVDPENLTRQLEQLQQAGLGGVEICPIYGAKGSEDKFIEFLSPRWMAMLAHTTTEAKRLGLGVDMTTGTGWPFGGPNVSDADASARVILKSYDVAGGAGLTERLPAGKLRCLRAVSSDRQQMDLTSRVRDGRLDWTAPPGKWRLYAVVQSGPVQKVKRAAPGGVGNVLDPFSVAKLDRYLARFDQAFADFRAPLPRAQFHDSYEYYNAQWTDDFFEQFRTRRGYDLRDHLPALFGEREPDTVARVKCDYRKTIADLHLEYVRRWTAWCHAHGMLSRNQAHGSPTNLLDTYAAADIPEMEVYRSAVERQIPMMKLAASAAHITGKKLVSAESFTWLGEHFNVPLSQIKPAADMLFLSGVNHLVYHGTPYSPADAAWPGWQFYAAVNFGPQGGLGRDLPAFNAYVTRVQSVLQAGRPANDVLLYLPIYDKWQTPAGLMMPFETEGRWMESLPFHEVAMELWKNRFGFDVVSDRLLADAKMERSNVVLGGNRYRVVVVPPCRTMPPETMRKLVNLAKNRATVIFMGDLPADVPGLNDLPKRRAELNKSCAEIRTVKQGVRVWYEGIRTGKDLVEILRGIWGMPHAFSAVAWHDEDGLPFARRALADGYYFLFVNRGEKPFSDWVRVADDCRSAMLMDPLGESRAGKAAVRGIIHGGDFVYLQLQPGESLVVRTFDTREVQAKPWRYTKPAGDPVAVAGTWKVQFIDGGPVLPAAYETKELASWTTRDDPEAKRFAGTAHYAIEFDRPAGAADDWLLDLGRVCESARVSVNGHSVGTLFCSPFRVAVGEYLRPGRNTLEVEVTNLAANRVRDLDQRKVSWKYFYDANLASHPSSRQRGVLDASKWPLRDSGLIGPVRLVPVKVFTP